MLVENGSFLPVTYMFAFLCSHRISVTEIEKLYGFSCNISIVCMTWLAIVGNGQILEWDLMRKINILQS